MDLTRCQGEGHAPIHIRGAEVEKIQILGDHHQWILSNVRTVRQRLGMDSRTLTDEPLEAIRARQHTGAQRCKDGGKISTAPPQGQAASQHLLPASQEESSAEPLQLLPSQSQTRHHPAVRDGLGASTPPSQQACLSFILT